MRKLIIGLLSIILVLPVSSYAAHFESQASYQVCFTPGQNCTQEIVDAINNAVSSVQVQAYNFTSRPIGKALVTARERGVKVEVILDRSTVANKNQGTPWFFIRHGIPVWIDKQPAIAHNKVMVIDETRVVTGSFNFTRSAQERNAENVLIIDDGGLAKKYLKNWQRRRMVSERLALASAPVESHNWLEELWQALVHWFQSLFKR